MAEFRLEPSMSRILADYTVPNNTVFKARSILLCVSEKIVSYSKTEADNFRERNGAGVVRRTEEP